MGLLRRLHDSRAGPHMDETVGPTVPVGLESSDSFDDCGRPPGTPSSGRLAEHPELALRGYGEVPAGSNSSSRDASWARVVMSGFGKIRQRWWLPIVRWYAASGSGRGVALRRTCPRRPASSASTA